MPDTFDYLIIGAGIIGLTTAYELKKRYPACRIGVLEKENRLGAHASGRNSGVLHSGIYYPKHTLKAKVCSTGARRMFDFAQNYGIPVKRTGKLIVATSEQDVPGLDTLLQNARDNHIHADRLASAEIRALEPYAQSDYGGIVCHDTAVIDPLAVLKELRRQLESQGVQFFLQHEFRTLATERASLITSDGQRWTFGFLFNCAGAHADEVAKQFNLAQDYELIPFKGIYYKLDPRKQNWVRSSIYPVPNLFLPFLGVHFTRVISGDVYVGPTAIPALGRENYGLLSGMHFGEAMQIFRHLAGLYIDNAYNFRRLVHLEMSKYAKPFFVKSARRLVPLVQSVDLVPSSKVGIRPQLFNIRQKKLEMDYILEDTPNSMHILNAISPAFTGSFAFAEFIVSRYEERVKHSRSDHAVNLS